MCRWWFQIVRYQSKILRQVFPQQKRAKNKYSLKIEKVFITQFTGIHCHLFFVYLRWKLVSSWLCLLVSLTRSVDKALENLHTLFPKVSLGKKTLMIKQLTMRRLWTSPATQGYFLQYPSHSKGKFGRTFELHRRKRDHTFQSSI